jgi:hypothetical protein
MKRFAYALIMAIALIFPVQAIENIRDVSVMALVVTPEKFDGSLIRTVDFLRLEFEGDSIYLNREDSEHRISKNGLWIMADDIPDARKKDLNNKYVLVEGLFSARILGHMGAYSGAITNVTRLILF